MVRALCSRLAPTKAVKAKNHWLINTGLPGMPRARDNKIKIPAIRRTHCQVRDITELFARDKMPVIGLQSEPGKNGSHMTFTVQVANTHRLRQTLNELGGMDGVVSARRR